MAAVDGEPRRLFGYAARGVPYGPDDGTVAGWASLASLPFAPEIVLPSVRAMIERYPEALTDEQIASSFNPSLATAGRPVWVSPGHFGLDQGIVMPASRYDLVVVGGGAAGLVAARAAAALGVRVALVERELLGGTSLNTGSVPSKTLLRTARAYAEMQQAARYGAHAPAAVAIDALRRCSACTRSARGSPDPTRSAA